MIDIYEIVCNLCDLKQDSDYDDVHQALWDKYEVDMDNFEKIIKDLLPLIDIGESPLTGIKYKGFSKQEGGCGFWLAKLEIK